MGADLIGWRPCPLQAELDPAGFLGKLKLRAYRGAIEAQVPPEGRAAVKLTVEVTGRPPRQLSYPQIVDELDAFERGIPECATCPLAGGRPLGCYHYVTYPIDEAAEELLFAFFTQPSQVETRDSISDQLYRDLVSKVPSSGTGWHTRRGPGSRTAPSLAVRAHPLRHQWGRMFARKKVDSAQLLKALFISLGSLPLVAAYARFWTEFVAFATARGASAETSRTLGELFALQPMMLQLVALAPDGAQLIADA